MKLAVQATLHCLTGCAIGEIVGMVVATGLGWGNTASIATMELVDNAFILLVPGALAAGLGDALFWWSLGASLVLAFVVTVPVNYALIRRGRGHAATHRHHGHV